MKIVYVVDNYVGGGGMERVLSKKANYLVAKDYDVAIISTQSVGPEPFFHFDPKIKFYNLGVIDKKQYKTVYLDQLSALLNIIQPDIAISTGIGLSVYLSETQSESKKILEYHFSKYKRKYWFTDLDKYTLGRFISDHYTRNMTQIARSYDKFIVLTEEDKESWRNVPNIEVIANPISFIPEKHSTNENKRVIMVGRFTYQKGIEKMISIWSAIHKQHPDWKLAIYGDGKKKSKIEKLISKYQLASTIEIKQPTKQIEEEFINSAIYVMTSRYEGFPLVLLEAMACGLPVVSYTCKCGPRDIVNNELDGFLVAMNDPKTFETKLSLLIENEKLRQEMGLQARTNILRYTEDKIMPSWDDLFTRILS